MGPVKLTIGGIRGKLSMVVNDLGVMLRCLSDGGGSLGHDYGVRDSRLVTLVADNECWNAVI